MPQKQSAELREIGLASAFSTVELSRRPSRPPDHAAENRALVALAHTMATSPDRILQELANTALTLCHAHSAGLSLLEDEDQGQNFHWRAISGEWVPHLHGGTPREFGPCGTVLDRNMPLMFSHPERDFPYFGEVTPLLEEALLIPFYIDGVARGTIWVVSHDETRRFDAEDLRVMTNLGNFTALAYQTVLSLDAARKSQRERNFNDVTLDRFAAIIESSDDAIISKNLSGVINSWNPGATRLFGYSAEEAIGQNVSMLIPPELLNEEPEILARIRKGERIDHYETVRRRKDGSLIDISLTVSPIRDASGRVVGASKIARDNSERKRADQLQAVLLGEMRHRAGNLNALITALANQSRVPDTPAVDQFLDRFLGRLRSILAAAELALASPARTPDVSEIMCSALKPFVEIYAPSRIVTSGPSLEVSEKIGAGLALAVHELATNAVKYGALSTDKGKVTLSWTITPSEAGKRVEIEWRETDGPVVSVPTRAGFGTRVIHSALSSAKEGTIELAFESNGLRCRMAFLTPHQSH